MVSVMMTAMTGAVAAPTFYGWHNKPSAGLLRQVSSRRHCVLPYLVYCTHIEPELGVCLTRTVCSARVSAHKTPCCRSIAPTDLCCRRSPATAIAPHPDAVCVGEVGRSNCQQAGLLHVLCRLCRLSRGSACYDCCKCRSSVVSQSHPQSTAPDGARRRFITWLQQGVRVMSSCLSSLPHREQLAPGGTLSLLPRVSPECVRGKRASMSSSV